MRRLLALLALVALTGPPAGAVSFYVTPDVPTDNPPAGVPTYFPWDVVRNDSGVYSLALALTGRPAIDALHRMNGGDWLFSLEAPAELPPGSGVFLDPRDVIRYNGVSFSVFWSGAANGVPLGSNVDAFFLDGGDTGTVVVSFDVPTTIGGSTYDPSDLVRFPAAGPVLFFDASATVPPIPITSNVTGADYRPGPSQPLVLLTFDVPTTLGAATYVPGQIVSWNPGLGVFALYYADPLWPVRSVFEGFSMIATPGFVPPTITVSKSLATPGNIVVTWSAGCSVGGEDYGIYEGILGTWYSHFCLLFTDPPPAFTEDFTPGAGSRYYLVVPSNPNDEGSYGTRSNGTQRPRGVPACTPTQEIENCP